MIGGWQNALLIFFRTVNQILTAGIAITAFSLLLFAFGFNLRDRVVRTFLLILSCVVIVFTAEALGSSAVDEWQVDFWLHFQWVGIVLLPPIYLHFSDALLATTGRPSRWRRLWAIRVSYAVSALFLASLPFGLFLGPLVVGQQPAPHLSPTPFTDLFTTFYLAVMVLAWINFARAYSRTVTRTSRRRMRYLLISALAPAFGSFPYLLFNSSFAAGHPIFFWALAGFVNFFVGGLVVVMAYSVSFFGVSWSDRVIKSRLFRWIMRGPVTASFTLGFMTIVRRVGVLFGLNYTALVPIVVVVTIILLEYLITLLSPIWERYLFYGVDRNELALLQRVQDRLLTRNDLRQYIELLLAAVCDRLQAPGAYLVTLNGNGLELAVEVGKNRLVADSQPEQVLELVASSEPVEESLFRWGDDYMVPLYNVNESDRELIGVLGISQIAGESLDSEQQQALQVLVNRAQTVLADRITQEAAFHSLEMLTPQMEYIQEVRAASHHESSSRLIETLSSPPEDINQWVKEALTHYWGGPKLTQSPLMQLNVVKKAVEKQDGNYVNALRSVLRKAIEKVKPEGERRFTGDWILYNILDMKFLEGRKVREVALRLAMSEADLYRKQRVAIEEVAKAIIEMETHTTEEQKDG